LSLEDAAQACARLSTQSGKRRTMMTARATGSLPDEVVEHAGELLAIRSSAPRASRR